MHPDIQDYYCAPSVDDERGGYRVTATVHGMPVALWVNIYTRALTDAGALSLLEMARRRAEAHAS